MADRRIQSCSSPSNRSSGPSPTHFSSLSSPSPQPVPLIPKKTPKDFTFIKTIGEGSFSTVYLAKECNGGAEFAVKVCDKSHIIKEKKQAYVKREKEVLAMLNMNPSPFFVRLYCTFQDDERLYFVITYAKNGELLTYIHKVGCFDPNVARFYSSEVILALDHLHRFGVIHRDIKPENILLNEHMHILLTDFGSAKILEAKDIPLESTEGRKRRSSFVGTADYIPPELLTDKISSPSSDLWALGCLIYQMMSGLPPFRAPSDFLIFQKIQKLEYTIPDGFDEDAADLVKKLLEKDPDKRLGAAVTGGLEVLKRHAFFNDYDWSDVAERKPPQILPFVPSSGDSSDYNTDHLEPGFDQIRLLNSPFMESEMLHGSPSSSSLLLQERNILSFSDKEKRDALEKQLSNPYNKFVNGNIIIKQGFIEKRKGLFARRRMFLLTTGPHLYYVDPVSMMCKGEVPFSSDMWCELKNFKVFFLHTPNRTYYLEDTAGYAKKWAQTIEQVRDANFSKDNAK